MQKIDKTDYREARGFVPPWLHDRFRQYVFERNIKKSEAMEEILSLFFQALDEGVFSPGGVCGGDPVPKLADLVRPCQVECEEFFSGCIDPSRVREIIQGAKPTMPELELLAVCIDMDIRQLIELAQEEFGEIQRGF